MATQYRKIADYDTELFHPDSPVIVEKMRLAHDLIYGANVLQITFRNVDELNIYGLGISIVLKDGSHKPVHEPVIYNYYAMEALPGKTFGAADDIFVEPEAVEFEVTVIRADLAEGRRFHGEALLAPVSPAKPTESLGELEEAFLARVAALRPKLKVLCAPEEREDRWRCVCKRVYPLSMKKCPVCRMAWFDLLGIVPDLKEEKRRYEAERARLEQERLEEEARRRAEEERRREEEERQRREEEERRRQAEKEERERREEEERQRKARNKKRIKIAALALSAACAVVCAIVFLPKLFTHQPEEPEIIETPADEPPKPTLPPAVSSEGQPETRREWGNMLVIAEGLDATQIKTLWRLFGVQESALGEHETVVVSTDWQNTYMGALLGGENVESAALSGALVIPRGQGAGLHVTLYNIVYCTEEMFIRTLESMGLEDADVVIAAPQKASGSTALGGLLRLAAAENGPIGEVIGFAAAKTSMNLRCGPGVEYERYVTVPMGTELEVLERTDNGWYRVIWPESPYGYAYTSGTSNGYYSFRQASEESGTELRDTAGVQNSAEIFDAQ